MDDPAHDSGDPGEPGEPYCGNCGYVLTGCTEASKCPECGKPLVEVLMRPQMKLGGGKRYRSKIQLWGMPLVSIASGPSGNESSGHAKGFIAIGDVATGVVALGGRAQGGVAIGGMATGLFSIGGMSIGLINAFGGMTIGGFATGGWAMGGFAQGGGAVGFGAQGGMAIGYFARAGGAFGVHRISPGANDPAAVSFFDRFSWFFANGLSGSDIMGAMAGSVLVTLTVAAVLLLIAWMAYARADTSPGLQ